MLAAVAPIALGGCGLPVGFQVASLLADVVSYAATEKTLGDHGLSLVAEKDCAVWRGIKGEDICRDTDAQSDNIEVAAIDHDEESPSELIDDAPAASLQTEIPALAVVENTAGAGAVAVTSETLLPTPPVKPLPVKWLPVKSNAVAAPKENRGGTYYVIASFHSGISAKKFSDKQKTLSTMLLSGNVKGRPVFRVAVGPVEKSQRKPTWKKLSDSGYKDAWALKVSNPNVIVEVATLR